MRPSGRILPSRVKFPRAGLLALAAALVAAPAASQPGAAPAASQPGAAPAASQPGAAPAATQPGAAPAATLTRAGPTLAELVRAASDGDVIAIPPGTFYACAVIDKRLTLAGAGPMSVLSDSTCGGKAILVAHGGALTLRDLTLARARVPDGNGAGVRLEAGDLIAERVVFENNQVGVLASGAGQVVIRDSRFVGGGVGGERPTYAVLIGAAAPLLQVTRSVFGGVKGGQIASDAARTELAGVEIEAGTQPGAGFAVRAAGALLLRDSTIRIGPAGVPRDAAILAQGSPVRLTGNRLQNGSGRPATLLLDWSGADPVLEGNLLQPGDRERSSAGLWRHRAGDWARAARDELRHWAGRLRRAL